MYILPLCDLRAGAGAYANHPKYRFRIYLGTENQEPDRLIRQHVENSDDFDGHDATPAFRGLVYIVFEDLPLDEFGNRIPPITAEIAWAGAPQAVVDATTFLSTTSFFTDTVALDAPRGYLYYRTNSSPSELARIRVSSGMLEELRVAETDLGIDLEDIEAVDPDGNIYVTHGITEQSFRKIDGDTLQVVASASFASQVDLAIASACDCGGTFGLARAGTARSHDDRRAAPPAPGAGRDHRRPAAPGGGARAAAGRRRIRSGTRRRRSRPRDGSG